MRNTLSFEKGHPNPHFYRHDWFTLNGKWDFLFDRQDEGKDKAFFTEEPASTLSIEVPYAYETEKSGISDKTPSQVVWYWKRFPKPSWDKRTFLHIDRCDYCFEGYLNGKPFGQHVGGYDAFAFDITDFLTEGDNFLAIRVYDDKNPAHLRGKQTWKKGPFECFYRTTTGIYGDVWLEGVAKAHLISFFQPSKAKKGFSALRRLEKIFRKETQSCFRFLFTEGKSLPRKSFLSQIRQQRQSL